LLALSLLPIIDQITDKSNDMYQFVEVCHGLRRAGAAGPVRHPAAARRVTAALDTTVPMTSALKSSAPSPLPKVAIELLLDKSVQS
jgi:hypothetical protein